MINNLLPAPLPHTLTHCDYLCLIKTQTISSPQTDVWYLTITITFQINNLMLFMNLFCSCISFYTIFFEIHWKIFSQKHDTLSLLVQVTNCAHFAAAWLVGKSRRRQLEKTQLMHMSRRVFSWIKFCQFKFRTFETYNCVVQWWRQLVDHYGLLNSSLL